MDNRELAALHSKLVIYRNGLQNAKARGDLDKARQWLEGIAASRRTAIRDIFVMTLDQAGNYHLVEREVKG